ncbi:MAG: hypothetical protein AAF663_11100 [Planctomycetota bacterium]
MAVNLKAVIAVDVVRQIERLLTSGITMNEVARRVGTTPDVVKKVRDGTHYHQRTETERHTACYNQHHRPNDPTPAEIAAACERIRRRREDPEPLAWTVPEVVAAGFDRL